MSSVGLGTRRIKKTGAGHHSSRDYYWLRSDLHFSRTILNAASGVLRRYRYISTENIGDNITLNSKCWLCFHEEASAVSNLPFSKRLILDGRLGEGTAARPIDALRPLALQLLFHKNNLFAGEHSRGTTSV
jgi:hypothetical protein